MVRGRTRHDQANGAAPPPGGLIAGVGHADGRRRAVVNDCGL